MIEGEVSGLLTKWCEVYHVEKFRPRLTKRQLQQVISSAELVNSLLPMGYGLYPANLNYGLDLVFFNESRPPSKRFSG